MAATVYITECNGAGEDKANKTDDTIRFKDADDANVDTANRLSVPTSGSNYSYEKWLRLDFDTAPAIDITNIKFYTDGSGPIGTGITLWARTAAGYSTPAKASSSSGYTNAFTYTSASPLSLGAGPFTGDGGQGLYVVLMVQIGTSATNGSFGGESITFSYDET